MQITAIKCSNNSSKTQFVIDMLAIRCLHCYCELNSCNAELVTMWNGMVFLELRSCMFQNYFAEFHSIIIIAHHRNYEMPADAWSSGSRIKLKKKRCKRFVAVWLFFRQNRLYLNLIFGKWFVQCVSRLRQPATDLTFLSHPNERKIGKIRKRGKCLHYIKNTELVS